MREIDWPVLPSGDKPVWNGSRFLIGGVSVPFLSYSANFAGWDDELTSLHVREAAGAHPIDLTSRHHAIESIRMFYRGDVPAILEIGCSDGYLLRDLRAAFPGSLVVGAEVAPQALAKIAEDQPGIPLIQLDILDCPLKAKSFDVVVALNVLEHVEDDVGALRNMAGLLDEKGLLVIEVPAGPGLYDAYDKQLHHFRRYKMPELLAKVRAAGLKPVKNTHIGFFVFPAFAAVKKLNRLRAKSLEGQDVVSKSIRESKGHSLLAGLFKLEDALFSRISLPFGIRCVVIAEKPAGSV
jgi:SAM-dependent methyltransferase